MLSVRLHLMIRLGQVDVAAVSLEEEEEEEEEEGTG